MPPPENLRSMHWHSVCWRRISAALFKHRTGLTPGALCFQMLFSEPLGCPNQPLMTVAFSTGVKLCEASLASALFSFSSLGKIKCLRRKPERDPYSLWIGSLSVAAYGSAAGQSITAPRQQETEIFECERLICWQNICVYNGPILDQWWLHWQLRHSLMFLTWKFKNKGLLLVTFPRFSLRSNCKVWEWLSHGHGGGIGAWESQATRPVSAPPSSSSRWLISSRTRNLRPDIAWEWPTAVP